MAKHLIFKEGVFNSTIMADGFSIDSYKSSLYPIYDGDVAPITDLQEWYLTSYLLFVGMANGKRIKQSNSGTLIRDGNVSDDFAGGTTWFPIKKMNDVTKVEFDIKLGSKKSSSPYNTGNLRLAHVNGNNEFIADSVTSISEPSTSDYQHISIDVNVSEIDYFGITWNDGIPYIDNIYITGIAQGETPSGGAGSGYIGNSLLSNKKMVGYNVPTSSAEGTKTESVEVFDSNYVANKPKAGNGHCRIKLLNEVTINDAFDLFTTTDVSSKVVNSYSKDRIYLNPSEDTYTDFVSYLGNPDYMLVGGQDSNGKKTPTIDTVNKTIAYTNTSMGSSASWTLIPITQLSNVIKIKATVKFDSKYNQYSSLIVKLYYIDGNTLATGNSYEIYIPWQSSSNYNVGDWYDLEVNCSMAKCDYICFGTGWDTVTFKNIKLYSM